MLFVIYDEELKDKVLKTYMEENDKVLEIYKKLNEWINDVYNRGSLAIPAIFASKVFFEDETWNPSMQTRAIAAMFQLLIKCLNLPLWVFWGDVELDNETVRIVYIFSSASRIEGIKGRVIVGQFSDDDREVEVSFKDKHVKLRTLEGAVAILYTIFKEFGSGDLNELLKKADENFQEILNETVSLVLESKIKEKDEKRKKIEPDELELPQLDEELKGLES